MKLETLIKRLAEASKNIKDIRKEQKEMKKSCCTKYSMELLEKELEMETGKQIKTIAQIVENREKFNITVKELEKLVKKATK